MASSQQKPIPLFLVFLLPALASRAWLISRNFSTAELTGAELLELSRGALEDLSVAVLLSWMIGCLPGPTIRKYAARLLLIVWTVLCYGQYEHVSALGASLSYEELRYAFNRTFLQGSALAMTAPSLVAVLVAMLAFGLWMMLPRAASKHPRGGLVLSIGAVAAPFLLPLKFEGEMWRQRNFIYENTVHLKEVFGSHGQAATDPRVVSQVRAITTGSITGELRSGVTRGKKNVLLIILEGLSGRWLDPIAKHHGLEPSGALPFLSSLAETGMLFPNFITQDRHTDRGEFSLLCGDYSNVYGTPQMSVYAACGQKPCLPKLLRDAGYRTDYIQAAPLGFMLKSDFMPAAGFTESQGTEWFRNAHLQNAWGIDDKTFFEQSIAQIGELASGSAPWFLTMLTVGTHHPYLVSGEYAKSFPDAEFAARRYLDQALAAFFGELKLRGVLDSTLVLITTDESYGVRNPSPPLELLAYNWGFLIALADPGNHGIVADPYAQLDVPLSVLDYLGLPDTSRTLAGRSVFRESDRARELYFANNVGSRVFLVKDDTVTISSLDSSKRIALQFQYPNLFSTATKKIDEPELAVPTLQAMRPQVENICSQTAKKTFTLHPRGTLAVGESTGADRWLIGGQHLQVPPGSAVKVDLKLMLHRKSNPAPAGIILQLTNVSTVMQQVQLLLPPETELKFSTTLFTPEEIGIFNFNALAYGADTGDTIDFETAQLTVAPGSPADVATAAVSYGPSPAFPVWNTDLFPAASCIREKHSIASCPQQFVLLSPLFTLPKNLRGKLSASLTPTRGSPSVMLEVSSADGKRVLKRQGPVELQSGAPQKIELDFDTGDTGEPLQFRLGWVPKSPGDAAQLQSAELQFSSPAASGTGP